MEMQYAEVIANMVHMMEKTDEGKFSQEEMVAYLMGCVHTLHALGVDDDVLDMLKDLIEGRV